jgi:hypothetical protein
MEPNHPADMALYRRRFPGDPAALSLANWQTLEEERPDLFANTYRFWVRKPA